jgi:hypothetical protein
VIDSGQGTSVADSGNGLGWTINDGHQNSVEFWTSSAKPLYPSIYHNGPATQQTVAAGATVGDPKLLRVSLDYLGS